MIVCNIKREGVIPPFFFSTDFPYELIFACDEAEMSAMKK